MRAPERHPRNALQPLPFSALTGWADDDHAAALTAFARHCTDGRLARATGAKALGVEADALRATCTVAATLQAGGTVAPAHARAFFETHFTPMRVTSPGFLTGYFEPEVAGSRTRSAQFSVPLHRPPAGLADLKADAAAANLPGGADWGIVQGGAVRPVPDRSAVMDGALEGLAEPLVYLADPVSAFFIHIQGSARIRLTDGTVMRVGFAGKSGHAYTAIGRVLVERGLMALEEVTMESLVAFLRADDERADQLMRQNRSYIFFEAVETLAPQDGPRGAAGVALKPLRSLAVDRAFHHFGTPIYVEATLPTGPNGAPKPFDRLLIAEDTGSAIVGPARGDLFFGAGQAAGIVAGRIKHPATFTVLMPKPLASDGGAGHTPGRDG